MVDILIEGSPTTGAYVDGGNPARTIWLDTLIGYYFYIAVGGGDDLEYRKTTDGGTTWGAAVSVLRGATGIFKFALWPDWKTPGDTGTLIHIVTLDSSSNDVRYNNLDTNGDAQSSIVIADATGSGWGGSSWTISTVTLTKAIGGNLCVAWAGFNTAPDKGMRVSTNGGVTWLSRSDVFDGSATDGIQFMPGNETDTQDIYCFYWDYSANEISIKVYDDSLDSWSETLISASMNEFSPSFAGRQYTCDIRPSDNHILLFAWDNGGVSVSNLMGWDVNGAASITALTNVISAEVNHLSVGMAINPLNDDIYVAYTGDPADTWATALNMRYKVSTDGGVSWSAAIQLNEDAASDARVIWGSDIHPTGGGRWMPAWFLDTADDLTTSFVNSVALASSPPVPPPTPAPIIASGSNQQAGTISYISPSPENRVYELITPHNPGRWVMSFSGFGTPPIEYITQRGPFQDGETVKDFFLRPRVVQMLLRQNFSDRSDWWDGRAAILNEIRPNRQSTATAVIPGILRMVKTDGSVRDLNVFIQEGPRFEPRQSSQWDEWSFQEILRFVAHNPVLFDPTRVDFAFTFDIDDDLVFPITFPIMFGGGVIDLTPNINYTGTWLSLPIIVITGPLEGFRLDNLTTNEKLELSINVPAGRVVTIDTTEGFKTVTDDLGNNLIGGLTSDSDLATFHIAPDPEAPLGVNNMRLQGTSPTGATSVEIRYFTRFFGI